MTTRTGLVHAPPAAAGGAAVPIAAAWQSYFFLAAIWEPNYLIEIRHWPQGGRPNQQWFASPRAAADYVITLPHHNVFAGIVPRRVSGGGKDALASTARVLWAECDEPMATDRAAAMNPHMLVRSSLPGKAHAYWFTQERLLLADVERGNRRLAHHLGADMNACDAARILRVPGSYHHKTDTPFPVMITTFDIRPNVPARELCGHLPDPAPPRSVRPVRPKLANPDRDRLAAIPSAEYVHALTGREITRGMVTCPFHNGGQERTPSFSVGGPSDTLVYCFGCQFGGDIFSFAGQLWGLDPTSQFPEILTRLKEEFR